MTSIFVTFSENLNFSTRTLFDTISFFFSSAVTSPKSRGITKSNTMSNATGRAALGQPIADKRRSAYDGKIMTSTDKTNQLDADAL